MGNPKADSNPDRRMDDYWDRVLNWCEVKNEEWKYEAVLKGGWTFVGGDDCAVFNTMREMKSAIKKAKFRG